MRRCVRAPPKESAAIGRSEGDRLPKTLPPVPGRGPAVPARTSAAPRSHAATQCRTPLSLRFHHNLARPSPSTAATTSTAPPLITIRSWLSPSLTATT